MPLVAHTTRPSKDIRAEIEQTFGFLPPFFEPALASPQVLENLWQQTLSAYVLNPLSALFKERLNAFLSRFCTAPYCILVHSAALRPLGMTAQQVLALLDAPPLDQGTGLTPGALPAPAPEEAAAPAPDSPLEKALLYCATAVFLERADAQPCQAELRRLLGPDLYPHLVAYLAYIKTCHTWIEAHPEVSYEADKRAQESLGLLLTEEPALGDFFLSYQTKVRAQGLGKERRRATDETLRAEQARTAGILESITDAFFTLDRDWRVTRVNDQAERLMTKKRDQILGQVFWDSFPNLVGSVFERDYRRAVAEGVSVSFEEFYPPLDAWLEARAYPSSDGLSVFFQDITARKKAEEERERLAKRERFLGDLAERAQRLTDPDEVIADAVRSVGRFLGVGRCVFGDIDLLADTCTIVADYCADETVASIVGVFPFSAFGPFVVTEYAAGRAVAVDDVRLDPVRVTRENVAPYEAMGIRAHITAPVVHSSRLVSVVAVHSSVPRRWTPEEVELLQAVVERTWLTVEVLRQQAALAREAEELRAAHGRTAAILESITDAFYALDHEWRFTHLNSQAERLVARTREDLLGCVVWDEFPETTGSIVEHQYRQAVDEEITVTFDLFFAPLDTWFEVRAFPSEEGLSVFLQNINERRAMEAERERLAERERNISRQLQAALTPALPGRIPGLALAKYYEAALEEAGVGGDFYDMFPVDKGCTALVVGDLSGKGLAAASQVATVRNMLRFALYRARTLVGALQTLNPLLAEQGLLSGFATLFVGTYDGGAGTLTYANCGQEPALVRRAGTGLVEHLVPTGPVLGSFEEGVFEQQTVTLSPGDALAIFTDGLTEVGRSRTAMLNIEGMADLLAQAAVPDEVVGAEAMAEYLARRLVEGANKAAEGGVMRDDVCLLVAVAEGSG